jgi:DNA-binding transcriptional LysR family regulator
VELRDLRTFVQVTDSGSISAAADELHLVQSAVSQAVSRLEGELEIRLLERRPDGVRPTRAGADLARHAAEVLARVAETEQAMATYRGLARERVRLGLLPSIVPLLLSPLLRELHGRHPDLAVRVEEGLVADLLAALRGDRLDVAVLWLPVGHGPGLDAGRLSEVPLRLVAASDHRLAGTAVATLSQLRDESWITFRRGGPGYGWIEAAGQRGGFSPQIAAELVGLAEIMAFVQAGIGVTLLPAATVSLEVAASSLVAIPLEPPAPPAELGYVKRHATGEVPADLVIAQARELLPDDRC